MIRLSTSARRPWWKVYGVEIAIALAIAGLDAWDREIDVGFAIAGLLLAFLGGHHVHVGRKIVDTLDDAGDELVAVKSGRAIRVPVREIVNVWICNDQNSLVSLRLRHAGEFGDEIVVEVPGTTLAAMVNDLIARTDRARMDGPTPTG
jgi:hypothetical protein